MFIDIIIFIIFVVIALASSRNRLKQEEKRQNAKAASVNDRRYSTVTSHYSSATQQGARKDAAQMRSTFEQAKLHQERKFNNPDSTHTVTYSGHYNTSLDNDYYYQASRGNGHDDMSCKYDSLEPPHGSHWWRTEPDELERLIKLNHEHEKHLMQRMVKNSDKDW